MSDQPPSAGRPPGTPPPAEDATLLSPSAEDAPTRTQAGADEGSSEADTRAPRGGQPRKERPRVLGPYTLVRLLGRGGMGAVWEAVDFRLDRRVALKVSTADPSPDAIERFRREATHSARLRHPNIVSVHDVGFDGGQQYLVMDLVQGATLTEALRTNRLTYRRKAEILERVARAVQYAHEQGVIHRDLKPSNVMLEARRSSTSTASSVSAAQSIGAPADESGEPLVMDFGLAKDTANDASLSQTGQAMGTPQYMPPEQAEGRLAEIGPRSDVYSLGAILYEMLTGRPPFTGESSMQVLKAVVNDEPVPPRTISRDVPRDLETICLACLRKEPQRRYASAAALADDLRAWLAGEPISARPATWIERAVKSVRRHRIAALVLVLVMPTLVTLALLWLEHRKELSAWSTVASEDFADDGWSKRWRVLEGDFARQDGCLVSQKWAGNVVVWSQKLLGPVAIDYDAEMLPDSPPCDISLIWAKDIKPGGGYLGGLTHPIELKIGAYDGSYSAIMILGRHLDYDPFKPAPGVRYHVRIEVVDNRVSLAVDGRTLCTYTDPFPLTGGYAGLYGFYPGKAFGPVRIQTLSVAEKVPATAIGDAFAQNEEYEPAAEQYRRVVSAHPGTAIALEATYKRGLCEFRRGERDSAFTIWRDLAGSAYDELVALHRLDVLADADDFDGLLREMEALYRRATPATRKRVAVRWADSAHVACDAHDSEHTQRLLELHDRVFPEQTTVDNTAGECLLELHRYQDMIERYPHQRRLCAISLMMLGHAEVVADQYVDQRSSCALARFHCGMYDRLAEMGPEGMGFVPQGLVYQGRAEEALAACITLGETERRSFDTSFALLALGRFDEAAAAEPRTMWGECALVFARRYDQLSTRVGQFYALMAQRRFDEIDADPGAWAGWKAATRRCRGLQAAIAGDDAKARDLIGAEEPDLTIADIEMSLDQEVILPMARELLGEAGLFERVSDRIIADRRYLAAQCAWHNAMLARGRIGEDAYLAQPCRLYAPANRWLLSAIREERAGHREAAVERYRAYLATEPWRCGAQPSPLRELFAEWRIAALSR